MIQTCANIYLADQRGCSQMDWFRCFHTFNFGQYFNANRQPFGTIQVLNDNTLRGGHSIKMQVENPTEVLIIPLVGGVEYRGTGSEKVFIAAGELLMASVTEGVEYEISNPYEKEDLVNYLEIWFKNDSLLLGDELLKMSFDLTHRNQLLPLFTNEKSVLKHNLAILNKNYAFIGKYGGREEGNYDVKNESSGVLVFIIEGAFEVQNRLLHSRDCLTLEGVEAVEFEALSNDAIILFIETYL